MRVLMRASSATFGTPVPLFQESDMDEITAEMFKEFTGREPMDDDLERCNCKKVGKPRHMSCGWNKVLNLPRFEVGDSVK